MQCKEFLAIVTPHNAIIVLYILYFNVHLLCITNTQHISQRNIFTKGIPFSSGPGYVFMFSYHGDITSLRESLLFGPKNWF